MDKFQIKYLDHMERKTKQLKDGSNAPFNEQVMSGFTEVLNTITNRRSRRVFREKVVDDELKLIIESANRAPSSCNRRGVSLKEAPEDLIPLLVGGVGWCDKGTVLAFYADMTAYKSPYEKDFMPYLDTGFMAQNICLLCEVMGLGCCFINPNTHNKYKSEHLLTGAISIGKI
ncbi:MAG: nitroreductase family protein [Candidatus Heimdallarchaeota archaeon]